MALERQIIERKDFPVGRRGYDPDAVDAHLRLLADEIEELKRSSRQRSETLASAASEHVRAIVEAAENSAADIQRQAENDARELRAEASSDARSTREQASAQVREYVDKVSESTAGMLRRIDAMASELGGLVESLRTGSNRLNADLQLLEGNLSELRDAAGPRTRFEPEPVAGPPGAPEPMPGPPPAAPPAPQPMPGPPPAAPPALEPKPAAGAIEASEAEVAERVPESGAGLAQATAGAGPGDAPRNGSEDAESARLIALNMALNGTPRAETDRYLADNFALGDRASLLDEVYAAVDA